MLLNCLGEIARAEQAYAQAEIYGRQSLQLYHELGDKESASGVLDNLGYVVLHQHQETQAATHFAACLALGQVLGHTLLMANALDGLGAVAAVTQGQPQPAVRLWSAAVALPRDHRLSAGLRRSDRDHPPTASHRCAPV